MTKPTTPSKKKTNHDPSKEDATGQSGLQTYLKYSGLAFQLLAALGLAAWGGIKLDERLGNRFPFVTMILVLLALTGSMMLLIRQLPKE